MDALVETLNAKLSQWKPETAAQVRERVSEIISLADQDALDLLHSRAIEQEVLDVLDESVSETQITANAVDQNHYRDADSSSTKTTPASQ